jgi:1-deoxy-D-xylulose-5-phosphate synthase
MVLAPADEVELVHALHTALVADGPVAIRYPRGSGRGLPVPETPVVFEAGRAEIRRDGTDVALLAVGRMVQVAEEAAALLQDEGVSATVANMRWVKPIDLETVARCANSHSLIVTLEENTGVGGFGAAVSEGLADMALVSPVLRLAVPDCFVTHGATSRLLADIGLTPDGVRDAVMGRLRGLDQGRTSSEGAPHDTTQSRRRSR